MGKMRRRGGDDSRRKATKHYICVVLKIPIHDLYGAHHSPVDDARRGLDWRHGGVTLAG